MQNLFMPSHRAPPASPAFRPGPASTSLPGHGRTPAPTEALDALFVDLLNAYRASGGLARLGEVLALTRAIPGHDVARLAAWILERRVMSFEWQGDLWLPLFQFNQSDMAPTQATLQVVQAMNPVLGPWALAAWFARAHTLLENRSPADALDTSFPDVMRAAGAEPVIAVAIA